MNAAPEFLIVIHYPVDIGFAVGRLVRVFYDVACRCTGDAGKVHFAFTNLDGGKSDALPASFCNYLQFEPRDPSQTGQETLATYIRKHRINVLLGMDMPVQARFLEAARRAGIQVAISYFGAPLSSLLPWPLLVLKQIEVRYFRPHRPDHFIVESNAMYRTAVQGRGIPPQRVSVVRNGVALDQFTPLAGSSAFVYELYSIPRNRKVVVYMGHFHVRKGVDVLLRAAQHIVRDMGRSDLHFLFLGTTPQDIATMRRVVDLSSIEPHICLGGYQHRIPEILGGCTIGCIPTTGWDSFPLSPLEMQACGIPVVVTDCQGLPETIIDGVTGLVVSAGRERELADAILRLADDSQLCSRMGEAARRRIEAELTYETQVANLTTTIRNVLATKFHDPMKLVGPGTR